MSYSGVERTSDLFVSGRAVNGASLTGVMTVPAPFFIRRIKVKFNSDFTYGAPTAVGPPIVYTQAPAGGLFRIVLRELGNMIVAQFSTVSAVPFSSILSAQFGSLQINHEDEIHLSQPVDLRGRQLTWIVEEFSKETGLWNTSLADQNSGLQTYPKAIAMHFMFYEK